MRLLFLLATAAFAQNAPKTAAVSGMVKDSVTGKPLANYNISTYVGATWVNNTIFMGSSPKQVKSVTDDQGRYRLADLPAGTYRLDASNAESFGTRAVKRIMVSGQDLDGIDFTVRQSGSISGRVVDENKEPVPGLRVYLVSREYFHGVLGYFLKEGGRTDDRGRYTISRVEPEHPYLLVAEKMEQRLPVHSEAPLDPKLRRRVPMPTFYPNSPLKEGASSITIRPGEHRDQVDIEIKKGPNFCAEGTLAGPMGAARLAFTIEVAQPAFGNSSTGGMIGPLPGATTGDDGKFRICDLAPGDYRIGVSEPVSGVGVSRKMGNHALVPITIADRDLSRLEIVASGGPTLNGEVVWDADAPAEPVTVRVSLPLTPLLRGGLPGENPFARVDIPGTFEIPSLVVGDYALRAMINAPGMYVKDVTYAGHSVMNQPLHAGESMSDSLRVVIARDAATIHAQVNNKDGQPLADMQVIVLPAGASSEAVLQATMFSGETDQRGEFTSHGIAPGKYYVAASDASFDATPESIGRLWRARNRFQEVELTAGGSSQLTLTPLKID